MEQYPVATNNPSAILVDARRGDIVRILLLGAGVGLLVWGLDWLLFHWIFSPLLCDSMLAGKCEQSSAFASIAAQIIAGIAALFVLVRMRAFRPLLIVLFVVVALWNVLAIFASWPWWATALGMMAVFGIAYSLFTTLARLRSLLFAVILMVICLVLVRLAIVL